MNINHTPFCWLKRLAYCIELTYNDLSDDLFPGLTSVQVRDIQKRIVDGTYTLSPFFLSTNHINNVHMHKIQINDLPEMCISSTEEDLLVLTSLGCILNLLFIKENLFMENSLGLRINTKSYYDNNVRGRGNVFRLYKFDLTNSLRTINRKSLFCKLAHLVNDLPIMKLVSNFLSLPIVNSSGKTAAAAIEFSIPIAGLITQVLLNYALIEFDEEFRRVFPQLEYIRYVQEVFVSFPSTCTYSSQTFESFEQQVFCLFKQLNLDGKILSIVPGDAPVPCYGGKVWVSQDGIIEFSAKKA